MMPSILYHAQIGFLATATTVIGLISLANVDLKQPGKAILGGSYQLSVEGNYKVNFPLRSFSRDLWNTLQITLFDQSSAQVIHTPDGWLFTAEEFADPKTNYDFNVELDWVLETLDSKVTLLPVIVPDKARIYSDHLPHARTAPIEARNKVVMAHLADAGLQTLDIEAVLREARYDAAAFLQTDTHWTPHGANQVASYIAEKNTVLLGEQSAFDTVWPAAVTHQGDLTIFIETGLFSGWVGPEPELISIPQTTSTADGMSLFGDVDIAVTLVGTSFSANPMFNFDGFLKEHLQTDVLNVAQIGKGPFAPMRDYLTSDEFLNSPPVLIIWEIPERYISMKDFDR